MHSLCIDIKRNERKSHEKRTTFKFSFSFQQGYMEDLHQVLSEIRPQETEYDKRPLPGVNAEENRELKRKGVDCDQVYSSIYIGNL